MHHSPKTAKSQKNLTMALGLWSIKYLGCVFLILHIICHSWRLMYNVKSKLPYACNSCPFFYAKQLSQTVIIIILYWLALLIIRNDIKKYMIVTIQINLILASPYSLCLDRYMKAYFDGYVQDCSTCSGNALGILQFCTKPSIWSPCAPFIAFNQIKELFQYKDVITSVKTLLLQVHGFLFCLQTTYQDVCINKNV